MELSRENPCISQHCKQSENCARSICQCLSSRMDRQTSLMPPLPRQRKPRRNHHSIFFGKTILVEIELQETVSV